MMKRSRVFLANGTLHRFVHRNFNGGLKTRCIVVLDDPSFWDAEFSYLSFHDIDVYSDLEAERLTSRSRFARTSEPSSRCRSISRDNL